MQSPTNPESDHRMALLEQLLEGELDLQAGRVSSLEDVMQELDEQLAEDDREQDS